MDVLILLIFLPLLSVVELIYFKIADKYNIIDHPNHRSSHTRITIRGGGIIFSIALLLGSFYSGFEYAYFLLGLFSISFISFMDDIKPRKRRIRMLIHLTAVALLFYQLKMYDKAWSDVFKIEELGGGVDHDFYHALKQVSGKA